MQFNITDIKTPAYLIDMDRLSANFLKMNQIEETTGVRALVAIKSFTHELLADLLPLVSGVATSGEYESKFAARKLLVHSEQEMHCFSGAYTESTLRSVLKQGATTIILNSLTQYQSLKHILKEAVQDGVKVGLRVNVQFSVVDHPMYDPSSKNSRFGVKLTDIPHDIFEEGILTGIHYHNLCESDAADFADTLLLFSNKFSFYLHKCEWVNLGGGQLFTNKKEFDLPEAIAALKDFKRRFNKLTVYVEPGTAFFEDAGMMVTSVLDVIDYTGRNHLIVDSSATCHMPDILEMPYSPNIRNTSLLGLTDSHSSNNDFLIGSQSCLTGDIIGNYSFNEKPEVGDKLIIEDQLHYTSCKSTTFNGMKSPSLYVYDSSEPNPRLLSSYSYETYEASHSVNERQNDPKREKSAVTAWI